MAAFDPLSFCLAVIAIILDTLATITVIALDLPEWRQPWGYALSGYRPEDFCVYPISWILDSYETTIAFLCLLGIPVIFLALSVWWYCRRSCQKCKLLSAARDTTRSVMLETAAISRDLQAFSEIGKSIALEQATEAQNWQDKLGNAATTAAETIDALLNKIQDWKTMLRAEQEEYESLQQELSEELSEEQEANKTLQQTLFEEQEARKNEAETAAKAVEKASVSEKRLSHELAAEKQRAEAAEKGSREKDDALKTAGKQQEESSSELATAAKRIEQLQEEHKSKQKNLQNRLKSAEAQEQALQEKLDKATDHIKRFQKKHQSEQAILQDRLRTAELHEQIQRDKLETAQSQEDILRHELDKIRKELSEVQKQSEKADRSVSSLQKELTTAEKEIEVQKGNVKTLSGENSDIKQICAGLEQECKAANAAKAQQEGAYAKLLAKHEEELDYERSEATERVDRARKQHKSEETRTKDSLKAANAQIQNLEAAAQSTRLEMAFLKEKTNEEARAAAAGGQADKLQDSQSECKNLQNRAEQAELQTQVLEDELARCRHELEFTLQAKDEEKRSYQQEHETVVEAEDAEKLESEESDDDSLDERDNAEDSALDGTQEGNSGNPDMSAAKKKMKEERKAKKKEKNKKRLKKRAGQDLKARQETVGLFQQVLATQRKDPRPTRELVGLQQKLGYVRTIGPHHPLKSIPPSQQQPSGETGPQVHVPHQHGNAGIAQQGRDKFVVPPPTVLKQRAANEPQQQVHRLQGHAGSTQQGRGNFYGPSPAAPMQRAEMFQFGAAGRGSGGPGNGMGRGRGW